MSDKKQYVKPETKIVDKPSYEELLEMIDDYQSKIDMYNTEIAEAHTAIKDSNDTILKSVKNAEEAHDKYLRALADYQNLQRISTERIANAKNDGKMVIIKNLLPIMDNFERAKEAGEVSEGVELVYNLFVSLLKDNNVEEINPNIGDIFDDHFHEAIAPITGNEENKNTIALIQQKGYKFNDKVIRYAKVGVYVN